MELCFIMSTKFRILHIVLSVCLLLISFLYVNEIRHEKALRIQIEKLSTCYNNVLEQHVNGFEVEFADDVKSIIEERNVFFYRFSQDMCEACIYEDLALIRQFQDSIGLENVLILPSFSEDRNSMIRLSSELKGFRYKNIPQEKGSFPIDRRTCMEIRYMGYINNEGNIEMCFIPIKGEPEVTRRYLLNLKRSFYHS